jgi:hypothetical protein
MNKREEFSKQMTQQLLSASGLSQTKKKINKIKIN